MSLYTKQNELKQYINTILINNKTIGFVPTMGALHHGHLSLMKESLKNNSYTVASIFVNPNQFNNPDDLKKYPRTLEKDIEKIKRLNKNIIVYAPSVDDIYGDNSSSKSFDYDGLEFQMEGKHRPGHFNGVGTIVKKLFEIIQPTNAYFGEKDFQQLAIIKKLVEKYKIPVTIVGCKIHRESNKLAMSSRNERLSKDERAKASIIYETLLESKKLFTTKTASEVTKWVTKIFSKNPIFKLEYFEIAEESTLLTCKRKSTKKNIAHLLQFLLTI